MKDRLIKILIAALSEELINQGHKNSGSLIKSFEGRLMADGLGVEIWGNRYAHSLDKGVKWYQKKKRPPIKPLIEYFRQKGAPDPKAAAFATIAVWKNKDLKQGMPTANSFKYSKTGKRKGFIKEALKRNNKKIEKEMFSDATRKMNKKISKIFNQLEAHGGGSGFGGGGVWVF